MGTPWSCMSYRTDLDGAFRAIKHVNSIAAIIEGSWQLGTPRTEVIIKPLCSEKHLIHVCHTPNFPLGNVGVEA